MAKIWPPQGDDSPSFAFKAVCCCLQLGPPIDVFESRWTTQNSAGVCMCGCAWHGKWWKTRTWSGTLHEEAFESCDDGAAPIDSSDEEFSGVMVIDPELCFPASCSVIDTCGESSLSQGGSAAGMTCNNLSPNTPANGYEETDNTAVYTGDGTCQAISGIGVVVTGDATDAYSEEDTPDDAIARMLAHAGASDEDGSDNWDIWTEVEGVATYVTPAPADPNTGSCFQYQYGVWRLRRSQLLPNTEYTVEVEIWRAAYDGITIPDDGDYSLFGVQSVTGTTDATGFLKLDPVVVPNAVGYTTRTKKSTLTCVPT